MSNVKIQSSNKAKSQKDNSIHRDINHSKSRHSRENGNPKNSNYMKILDSCFRRNDRQWPFQTFYETIMYRIMEY